MRPMFGALAAVLCLLLAFDLWWINRQRSPLAYYPIGLQEAPKIEDIKRGEYLARIGNCISCHTRRGGEAFAGGVAFRAPYAFLGTLYSSNITPDRSTGIGNWTAEQFARALHEGSSADGRRLFPAFPYTYFTRVTDRDARAIFDYLRTIKPVRYAPPPSSAAFTQRWAMALWNSVFFKPQRFAPDPTQSAAWNRGAYLVTGLAHCGACHTTRNLLLAETPRAPLAGGAYVEFSAADNGRSWSAVNLTSSSAGLKAWSTEDLTKYLTTGHSRRAGIFGPMNDVVINSLQYLTPEDARAMAVYIKSLPALSESPDQRVDLRLVAIGAELYAAECEKCHLASGRGAFLKAPPLAGSAVTQTSNPASLINIILYGAKVGKGAPVPGGAWEDMQAFGEKLTNDQVAALSTYVRVSWGNTGGIVTPRDVAAQR